MALKDLTWVYYMIFCHVGPPWALFGGPRGPHNALCAESEVRKAVERSSYAVALKFRVFFLLLKSVKFLRS